MTFIILLLGLGVGVLVGLLGIGGGVVLVPAMVYFLHMDQHLAQGTSLFILLPPVGLACRDFVRPRNALRRLCRELDGASHALPELARTVRLLSPAGWISALE